MKKMFAFVVVEKCVFSRSLAWRKRNAFPESNLTFYPAYDKIPIIINGFCLLGKTIKEVEKCYIKTIA